jgi:hypothetical protein
MEQQWPLRGESPYYLFLVLILAVFVSEIIVMLLMSVFPSLGNVSEALLDAMLLVFLVSLLYTCFFSGHCLGRYRY